MSSERVYAVVAEGLILGTLIFAAVTYGAINTWTVIAIQWATLALVVVSVLRRPFLPSNRLPGVWLSIPIALLVLSVALSTAFSIYRYGSLRDALRIFTYIAFFYLVAINLYDRRAVVRFLTSTVIVAALLPFGSALQDWSLGVRAGLRLIPESFKVGTFPNENHFAAFLTLVLPAGLGLAVYFARERRWRSLIGIIACLGLVTAALLESLTRGAWLGTVLGLLAMLAVLVVARAIPAERKLQTAVGVAVLLLLAVGLAPNSAVQQMKTVVALGDTHESMAFRGAIWADSLPIIRDHALLGTGPRTFHLIYTQYRSTRADYLPALFVDYLHNDYLQYGVEMGVPAAVLLIGVLLLYIYVVGRHAAVESARPEFPLALGVLGSLVAFAIADVYSFELYVTANGLLFWAMLAVGYRLTTLDEIAG